MTLVLGRQVDGQVGVVVVVAVWAVVVGCVWPRQ